MKKIISIQERNGKRAVNARELHAFLESKRDFSNWIKDRITKYDLVENIDYQTLCFDYQGNLLNIRHDKIGESGNQQVSKIEYALTIDAAKELSMVEGNEKGKQARRYFIDCEKIVYEQSGFTHVPCSFKEALLLAAHQQEQIEEQHKQIEYMSSEIVEMKKKTDYIEIILASKETMTITQIAQDYGMSAKAFNKLLSNFRIQHKVNGQWILYTPYISQGYVHSTTFKVDHKDGSSSVSLNTEWRQKGRIFLYETLKAKGILPLVERQN